MKTPMFTATGSAEHFGRDRRTMSRIMEGVKPDAIVKGKQQFSLKTIAAAVQTYDARERPAKANGHATDEKSRLAKAQADLVEAKVDKLKGKNYAHEDVERVWTEIAQAMRARFLALPSRVAQVFPSLEPPVIAEISKEVDLILSELADSVGVPNEQH